MIERAGWPGEPDDDDVPGGPLPRPAQPEQVSWQDFLARFRWQQGEHVALIGPTGAGKTTLALAILPRREYVVIVATKPRDPVVAEARKLGYRIMREWPEHVDWRETPRIVLWPRFAKLGDLKRQQKIIHRALGSIFSAGGWTVYVDELAYLTKTLRLESAVSLLLQQGRSLGVTFVCGTQRPAHVPLLIYDQSTHLFLWRDNDEANLKRLGGMGGMDSKVIRATVAQLPLHDVLYVNTRGEGSMTVTRVDVG